MKNSFSPQSVRTGGNRWRNDAESWLQMTAVLLNNVSFCSFTFRDASKGIQRHVNQTANAISLRSANSEIPILSITKRMPSAVFTMTLLSQTNWFSSQISSLFAHLLDNNYLVDFMAEGKSLLCQPFPESMVVFVRWEGEASQGWNASTSSQCSWTPISEIARR